MKRSVYIQLDQIRQIERRLFMLIETQQEDKEEGKPYNWERAFRIDELQIQYAQYEVQ